MKWIMLLFFSKIAFVGALDLEFVRINYEKAVSDKTVCARMIEQLTNDKNSSVHLAYLGAFQTIWAKHTINPIEKLTTFKKGKRNIEQAVARESDNVEVRFVRLSIQENCPGFLGYKSNIKQDRSFLMDHQQKITSPTLKKMVGELLK